MKIKVQPMLGGEPQMCNVNVQKRIKAMGGTAVYGWLIKDGGHGWTLKNQHCVWRSPEGELQDVSPVIAGVEGDYLIHEWPDETEFVEDDKAYFETKTEPGYYLPPKDEPHLVRAADYMRRGDWAMYSGDIDKCRYWTNKANHEARKGGSECGWTAPESLDLKSVIPTLV